MTLRERKYHRLKKMQRKYGKVTGFFLAPINAIGTYATKAEVLEFLDRECISVPLMGVEFPPVTLKFH